MPALSSDRHFPYEDRGINYMSIFTAAEPFSQVVGISCTLLVINADYTCRDPRF
jgi:hypothetical protein